MNRILAKILKIAVGLALSFILAVQLNQITGVRTPGALVCEIFFHTDSLGSVLAIIIGFDTLLMFGIVCGIYVFASRFDARSRAS